MLAFAVRMIRDKYKTFAIYVVSSLAFLEMYIALFPSISEQSAAIDQMIKSFPPQMFQALNMDPSSLSFGNMQAYLSSEYLSFLWPIMAIVFAISVANYISVNEIEKGTIEILMSLPVNRTKVFLQRYFAGLAMLIAFAAISLLGAVPLAGLHGVDFVLANYITAAIGASLFVWAVYSLAVLFSVIFSEKNKATMASGGVLVLMYVIYIISNLNDDLANLKYISFFNYFSGSDLLAKNIYPEYMIIALGGFAFIATVGAVIWFRRRDLSV